MFSNNNKYSSKLYFIPTLLNSNKKLDMSYKFEPKSFFNYNLKKNTNFNQNMNIEENSICLALKVLNISKTEYDLMSLEELKYKKKYTLNNSNLYAYNILIYYKKNN